VPVAPFIQRNILVSAEDATDPQLLLQLSQNAIQPVNYSALSGSNWLGSPLHDTASSSLALVAAT
jgi:hypothetical protein